MACVHTARWQHLYGARRRGSRPLRAGLQSDDVVVGFRPEAAQVNPTGELRGKVYTSDLHGAYTMLHVTPYDG